MYKDHIFVGVVFIEVSLYTVVLSSGFLAKVSNSVTKVFATLLSWAEFV